MMFLQTSALMALVASVSGHIIMSSPVPFEWENSAEMQFPLEPADFPCKQPSGKYAVKTMNKYKAGENMSVKLVGGATHSGGSCQFSITTDLKPTKNTQWKVLFSQIGGCPSSAVGNKSGDKDDQTNAPFSVPIPKDLPTGQYTMAWSWNNKSGNREFYMNCAPLEITGGSGDVTKVLGGLPDMFVANLPADQCTLAEGQDFQYPNPGKNVATAPGAAPGNKVSGAGCATQTKLGAGAGKLGSPSQATGAPASSAGGDAGGVFAPSASSAAAAKPTTAAAQPTTAPAGNSGSGSSGSSSGCNACSTDGAVVCIGSTQYGLCSRGCAVAQPLAAGTTCSNGKISRRFVPRAYLSDVFN